jgi:hypothetical protein
VNNLYPFFIARSDKRYGAAGVSAAWRWASLCLAFTTPWGAHSVDAGVPETAYIWQRAWTPELARAVVDHGDAFSQLDVLAAEVSLPSPTQYVRVDWQAIAATKRPFSVVVRLQRLPAAETDEVVRVAQRVLRRAEMSGATPSELQVDFDCASSRLPEYLRLIDSIRREVRPPRLTVTALPDWLSRPSFRALAAAVDGIVLQVHSIEHPRLDAPGTLCDPTKARRWIDEMSGLGRPFRVALPDYGCEVGFDVRGTYIGLVAEGLSLGWPAGTTVRRAMADPAALATLVGSLHAHPPPHLEAIAWFRFPAPGDRLCWRWETLSRVRRGEVPSPSFRLRQAVSSDGAQDLEVTNAGESDGIPPALPLDLKANQVLAWDLAPGWRTQADAAGYLSLEPDSDFPEPLQPGESRRIGWLRLAASSHDSPPH